MNDLPQYGTDWSSTAEVAPRKKSGFVRLLIWAAVLLAFLMVASCVGLFTWIIVNSPPDNVIEGGTETEEMREIFEDYDLLGPEEELLWCHFAGTSLDEKGCLLTEKRVGVFCTVAGQPILWGSPVVSMDYADIAFIEVTWDSSSFLPCSPVRVHVDDETWLQFELCGDQEMAARFMEDFERLCVEQSPDFAGVQSHWEHSGSRSHGAELLRGEEVSEEQRTLLSKELALSPGLEAENEELLWCFFEDEEEGGFLSTKRVGAFSHWEGSLEGETGCRELSEVLEIWYEFGSENSVETTVYIDTGEEQDLALFLSTKDALDEAFLEDLDRLCREQAGDHYAGLFDFGDESEESPEEEEEE